ncbi:MAG: SLC13 family permease [bacterium]
MTLHALATLGILAAAVAALALNRWRPDVIALGVLLLLALTGLVSAEEAVGGFGMPAVVALAAVFVLGAGLEQTGAAALVSRTVRRLAGRSERMLLLLLMGISGAVAAVMINLGAVSIVLPVALAITARRRISPTVLLLPLAYAAVFGGKLTLIAGPSNLIMAGILERRGLATLHLFDLLPVGLSLLVGGTAWMATVGWRLLPPQPPEEFLRARRRRTRLVRLYRLSERLFEARIPAGSPLAQRTIEQTAFGRTYGVTIVAVVRDGRQISSPPKTLTLRAGDRLVIEGRLDALPQGEALEQIGIELVRTNRVSLESAGEGIVEAVISPRSELAGRTLRDIGLRERYGLTVLALWREGRPFRTRLAEMALQVGDGLLIRGPWKALRLLQRDPGYIVLEEELGGEVRKDRMVYALLAIGVMIALTLAGVHIALSAGVAAAVIVLSRGLTVEEAYRAIDWPSIVLMAGMIPLGLALEKTGATTDLAVLLMAVIGGSPIAALAVILVVSVLIGHVIPPVAATILMAPLAIGVAGALGVSVLPFAMAVLGAMGVTVLTPFSNPVMLMVMAPGGYTPRDYLRSGVPLVAILLLLLLAVIPLAYPFSP